MEIGADTRAAHTRRVHVISEPYMPTRAVTLQRQVGASRSRRLRTRRERI